MVGSRGRSDELMKVVYVRRQSMDPGALASCISPSLVTPLFKCGLETSVANRRWKVRFPFVRRRFHEDAMLDCDRKINQLERAARAYLNERDQLRSELASMKNEKR